MVKDTDLAHSPEQADTVVLGTCVHHGTVDPVINDPVINVLWGQ